MWTISNFQSPIFLFIFGSALLGTIFWVTYSLQEISILFRKSLKKRAVRHQNELEAYRQELKKHK